MTVLVPVYNGERWIRDSLDSIVRQSYEPKEILVLDDASVDRTPEILAGYEGRVRVHRAEVNQGQFANVNRGVAMARGEYVAVMHADDVYDAEMLEVSVAALSGVAEAGAVFCLDRFLDHESREYGRLRLPAPLEGGGVFDHDEILDQLLKRKNTFLRTPGAVMRRRIYEELGGFRTDLGASGDFEMWLRVSKHAPVVLIDRHLYGYRHSPESEGNSYQRSRLEPELFFGIMDAHLAELGGTSVSREALAAYEAHRAEDLLLLAARAYAMGRRAEFETLLGRVKVGRLLGSTAVARGRLFVVLATLRLAAVFGAVEWLKRLIARRWHVPKGGRDS